MGINIRICKNIIGFIAFFLLTSNLTRAQEFNLINKESSLKIFGTSNLHDWEIDAEEQSGTIAFKNLEDGNIEKCDVKIVAESLKSGRSGMDKNTFKALNTRKYNSISFHLVEVKETVNKGGGKFAISSLGDLTVAGVKKRIPLEFSVSIVGNKVALTGEKKIKMTDVNVDPPTAMFGTITTGDEVTIKFSTQFK